MKSLIPTHEFSLAHDMSSLRSREGDTQHLVGKRCPMSPETHYALCDSLVFEIQVSRNNLKIEAMALVSPRMFWAIVRHGGVGPDKSFHDTTCALAPDIDWAAIEQRDRQRPERYADYVSH